MTRISLPFAAGFYKDSSLPVSAQECVNFYINVPQTNALSSAQLVGVPGLKSLVSSGNEANRGAHVMGGVPYFVNGGALYKLGEDSTLTNLGVVDGQSRVSMADNGEKLCIVAPGNTAYMYSTTTGLVEITDPDLGLIDAVRYKDGYYIFSDTSGESWRISELNDPTSLNPLDFGTAESDPDLIVSPHVNRNELYICGEKTIEPFQNIGGSGFPFLKIAGGVIPVGVHAKFSLVNVGAGFAFIGGGENERAGIYYFSGIASKISTHAIDNALQDYTKAEIAQSFAYSYSMDGEQFVCFTLPKTTFVYQLSASQLSGRHIWFERKSGTGANQTRSRINSLVKAYDKLLVGDTSGTIGYLDSATFTEYGNAFSSIFSTQAFDADGIAFFVSEIEATCESGVGLSGESSPAIHMDYSDDGGKTWTSLGERSLGAIGEFSKRQIWRRLGRVPRFRVFRFRISDPVKRVVIKLEADIG